MNTPFSDELISAYLDGELNAEEHEYVEGQLRENEQLRRLCDELRALRNTLQAVPAVEPPRDFAESVLRQAERRMLSTTDGETESAAEPQPHRTADPMITKPQPRSFRWRTTAGLVASAAALLLVVGLLVGPATWFANSNTVAKRDEATDSAEATSAAPSGNDNGLVVDSELRESESSSELSEYGGYGSSGEPTDSYGMPADPRDHFSADEAGPKSDAAPMELADDSGKGQPVRNQGNASGASPFGAGMTGAGGGSGRGGMVDPDAAATGPGSGAGVATGTERNNGLARSSSEARPAKGAASFNALGKKVAQEDLVRVLERDRNLLVYVSVPRTALEKLNAYTDGIPSTDAHRSRYFRKEQLSLQLGAALDESDAADFEDQQRGELLVVEGSPEIVRRSLSQLIKLEEADIQRASLEGLLPAIERERLRSSELGESSDGEKSAGESQAEARSDREEKAMEGGRLGGAGYGGGFGAAGRAAETTPSRPMPVPPTKKATSGEKTNGRPGQSLHKDSAAHDKKLGDKGLPPIPAAGQPERADSGQSRLKTVEEDSPKSGTTGLARTPKNERPVVEKPDPQPESEEAENSIAKTRRTLQSLRQRAAGKDQVVVHILFRFSAPPAAAAESPNKE